MIQELSDRLECIVVEKDDLHRHVKITAIETCSDGVMILAS